MCTNVASRTVNVKDNHLCNKKEEEKHLQDIL